ncbi:MAG: alpha/beta fold hydrolase, partial [Chloroflexota bacterium]
KAIVTLAKETRLYECPYDWRRALDWNAARLAGLLERWASATPSRRFVLVAHSMGGLVALSYLALYPREAERRIARLIMLGTPLRGAAAAVAMFQGTAMPVRVVARLHPNNDMGRLVRSMPAAYQLLPAPPDCFPAERAYPANWDLYDPTAWPVPMRPDYLAQAARHWRRLAAADPQVELVEIAGCHQSTVTDILRRDAKEAPGATYEEVFRETGDDSGDEQVPLWSTRLPGVHTYYVEEAHQMLPSNNAVLAAVVSLVHGGQPELPDSVPPPRHLITRLRMAPLAQRAAELRERLEQGEYSREDLWRLFLGE